MKHNLKYVISLVLMLLLTQSTWADPTVTIIKKLNGAVVTETSPGEVTQSIANSKCTLTVTPAQGYYVTKDFITAYSVVTGGVAQTPRRSPDLDNDPIEVSNKGENTDPTGETTYEFTMPADGSDVEVTVDFHSYQSYNLFIGETQVTDLNADNVLGDSKVVFSVAGNDAPVYTLTLDGAELTVPVKVALPNLTIDIQGTNSITTAETCLQKIDDAAPAVTFLSSSEEVGSLTLTTTGSSGVNNIGVDQKGSFSFSNQFVVMLTVYGEEDYTSNTYYFTDGSTSVAKILPSLGVQVGEIQVYAGNKTNVLKDEETPTVVYDAENHKLTLNGANISGAISTSLENLTIELVGNNSIYQGSSYATLQSSTGDAVTMTIQSTGTTPGTLTMNQPYTEAGTFADGHVTLDIVAPLTVVSGSLTGNDGNDNTVVIGVSYGLTVNGVDVTNVNASNVLSGENDGQVSYDAENNILTLNNAFLYADESDIVYSGSENLTIALNGSCYVNSITYAGQGETLPQLTFKKVEGALPSTTLRTPSDFRAQFSTVNYEDWLGLYIDDSSDTFYDVMSKTPSIYGEWNGETEKWDIVVESKFVGTVKYSLTYADENLAANNKTDVPFEEAFTLLGPATIKATITIDDVVSPEETAYYFGIMPNPLRFVYDGETAPEFAATLYPAVEGVTFTPYSSPGSFATLSEGDLTINGYGSGFAYANINKPENRTFSVITDSIAFKMEVVPPVPTITLASGSYSSTHDPIVIQGADIADSKIMYKWNNGYAYEYEEAIPIQPGTLKAWVEVVYDTTTGATVSSDVVTATYALTYDLTFAGNNLWATYYSTEDLAVPEGLTAYIVDEADDKTGVVTVSAISYIPRYEAVLLKRTNTAVSEYTATAYDDEEEEDDIINLLEGTDQTASIEDILMWGGYVTNASVYVLYNDEFVKATGTIPANRGFLVFGELANAPKLTIEIGDGATGIHSIENGKLKVENAEVYNLAGQRVAQPTKGLYIKNGTKVLVK